MTKLLEAGGTTETEPFPVNFKIKVNFRIKVKGKIKIKLKGSGQSARSTRSKPITGAEARTHSWALRYGPIYLGRLHGRMRPFPHDLLRGPLRLRNDKGYV